LITRFGLISEVKQLQVPDKSTRAPESVMNRALPPTAGHATITTNNGGFHAVLHRLDYHGLDQRWRRQQPDDPERHR
jgi:hypothetical protein